MQMRRERAEGKDYCLMPGSQKVMDSVPNYRVSLVPHEIMEGRLVYWWPFFPKIQSLN